jgi:hypothetical protein
MGGYDRFIVFGAIYFDESGGHTRHGRIGIAATIASTEQWFGLEREWREALTITKRLKSFHAKNNDSTQKALNIVLATLLYRWKIPTLCITLDQDVYMQNTTPLQRGWYGNAFGFARYISAIMSGDSAKRGYSGDIGYYVEQGGKGHDWIMQAFGVIYASDKLRADYGMAAYGPVDRRIHLPVHAPDLIAHEVVHDDGKSFPLAIVGDFALVQEITAPQIARAMEEFTEIRIELKKANQRLRNERRRRKKSKSE